MILYALIKTRSPVFIPFYRIALILMILLPVVVEATSSSSPVLEKLHKQMIDTMPIDWGGGIENTQQDFPIVYALMMGFAMQRQKILAQGNPKIQESLEELRYVIENSLKDLARKHGFKRPNDGASMASEDLITAFRNALQGGGINQWAKKSMKFDPATTAAAPLTQHDFKPLARFDQVEDDPEQQNNITLLGTEIAAAEKPVVHTEVGDAHITSFNKKGLICPEQCPPYRSSSYHWYSKTAFRMSENSPIQCRYYNDGRIKSQSTHEQQGADFWFSVDNGIYYLQRRTEGYKSRDYKTSRNGWEEVATLSPQKKPYVYQRTQYRNSIKHGLEHFYRILPSGKPYLSSTGTHSNGKYHGPYKIFSFLPNSEKIYLKTERIYRNGKQIKETHYNPDKTPKKEILYKSDGRTIEKEIEF